MGFNSYVLFISLQVTQLHLKKHGNHEGTRSVQQKIKGIKYGVKTGICQMRNPRGYMGLNICGL